jgi:hypothetical protein
MGLLSGCGNPLGKYDVRRVTLVPGSTLKTVDPDGCSSCDSKPQLLRIEFVSTTDLETASGGHALYIHGDFCPFKNEYQLGIFGPYYNDQPRLLYRRITSYHKAPDGRITMSVDSKNRHPTRNATGGYVYTAYLAPSEPAEQFSSAYDLRREVRDLCLRIDSPGYYLIPSRSELFRIPASTIQTALGTPSLNR